MNLTKDKTVAKLTSRLEKRYRPMQESLEKRKKKKKINLDNFSEETLTEGIICLSKTLI